MNKIHYFVLLVCVSTSAPAFAYFDMNRETVVANNFYSHSQKQITFGVVQRGTGTVGAPVSGSGDDIPMDMMFRLLAPVDWELVVVEEKLSKMPVSWKEGDSWVDTFDAIGKAHELNFMIDWNSKRVIASKISLTPEQQAKLLSRMPGKPSENVSPEIARKSDSSQPVPAVKDSAKKGIEIPKQKSLDLVDRKPTPQNLQAAKVDKDTDSDKRIQANRPSITLKQFAEEFVSKDVPNLTLRDAVLALLPHGWDVRMSESAIEQFENYRFDVLAQGPRGAALNKLLRPVGLQGTPYTFHKVFVVEGYK